MAIDPIAGMMTKNKNGIKMLMLGCAGFEGFGECFRFFQRVKPFANTAECDRENAPLFPLGIM